MAQMIIVWLPVATVDGFSALLKVTESVSPASAFPGVGVPPPWSVLEILVTVRGGVTLIETDVGALPEPPTANRLWAPVEVADGMVTVVVLVPPLAGTVSKPNWVPLALSRW